MKYQIAEAFLSVNGEGPNVGYPAFFIRFSGCNLRCSYCDTAWAQEQESCTALLSAQQLREMALKSAAKHITLTGGEPLLQKELLPLIFELGRDNDLQFEIETNGAVEIAAYLLPRVRITMDYKLPGSGMEDRMLLSNLPLLRGQDSIKFVCQDRIDLKKAEQIIREYRLMERCQVFFSPVFGRIAPKDMVGFLLERRLWGARLQLQLHKFIWSPEERGV